MSMLQQMKPPDDTSTPDYKTLYGVGQMIGRQGQGGGMPFNKPSFPGQANPVNNPNSSPNKPTVFAPPSQRMSPPPTGGLGGASKLQ